MIVKKIAITPESPYHASKEAFNDPEIRNCIMENSDPSTLFAIATASPNALRSFKQYPRTFLLASIDTLHPLEADQARKYVKAMLTRQNEDVFMRGIKPLSDGDEEEIGIKAYAVYKAFDCKEPWPHIITNPVKILERLATVQEAIDILEAAPIWLCLQNDLYQTWPRNPIKNRGLKHLLWLFELYCELYGERYKCVDTQHLYWSRRSSGPYKYSEVFRGTDVASSEMKCDVVDVYINLSDMLDGMYEEDFAWEFEKSYPRNKDDAEWVGMLPRTWDQSAGGREKVKHDVIRGFTTKIDSLMSLGIPVMAQMYRRGAHSKFRYFPKMIWLGLPLFSVTGSDWCCRRYKAFELKPLSGGQRSGYRLSMVFKNGEENPLRQVDFDAEIFTDGYQPPDLGTGSLEQAQLDWQDEVLSEDLGRLHGEIRWVRGLGYYTS